MSETMAGAVADHVEPLQHPPPGNRTGAAAEFEKVRRLGVRAAAVPVRDGCVELADLPLDVDSPGIARSARLESVGEGGGSMTFDADAIPVGDTLLLAAQSSEQSSTRVSLAAVLVKGGAPECLSLPTPLVHYVDPQPAQESRPAATAESTVREGGS